MNLFGLFYWVKGALAFRTVPTKKERKGQGERDARSSLLILYLKEDKWQYTSKGWEGTRFHRLQIFEWNNYFWNT